MGLVLTTLLLLADVEGLLGQLEAEDAKARYEACVALGELGNKAALRGLTDALMDEKAWVRMEAARALVKVGVTKAFVPTILRRMESVDYEAGLLLAGALADVGADAVPHLVKVLEGGDSRMKGYALRALMLAGRRAASALPQILDLVGGKDENLRRRASEVLQRIGPWAQGEVVVLADRLKYGDEQTKWIAATILAQVGPAAKAAIPELEKLVKEGSPRLKRAAAQALGNIDVDKRKPEDHPALRNPRVARERAPDRFLVRFETTQGAIDVEVKREWAPRGADRFYNLVRVGFFADVAFFRVVKGFVAQFGLHGDRTVSSAWAEANIEDDPVKVSNKKGWLTFAMAGPGTRTTQMFFNLAGNERLDRRGFAPVGRVSKGMEVLEALYSGYGEKPDQQTISYEGNAYLRREFPNLDYIRRAVLLK